MKKFILLSLIFLSSGLFAQISSNPPLPTDADEVVITFDASGSDLAGYSGNIYAHTGVKIQGESEWQYVIGEWGDNNVQPMLTQQSPNVYTLTINPSVREFYGVPDEEIITQMCFVFRGQQSTNPPQTEDLFIDVVQEGLTVSISSPLWEEPFYSVGEDISISALANNSESITLFVNNTEIASTTESEISHTYSVSNYGKQWIKAVATYQSDIAADSVYFYVLSDVPTAELPEDVIPGVNVTGTNEVTLVLHDPAAQKEFVFAIGNFSNWELDDAYLMNRTPDGKHYWITVAGLDPTKEYIYQYWIDGEIKIADPYTEKVSDPWNDKNISSTTYPNLISYPEGKTTGIASVLQIAPEEYQWEVTDFVAPPKDELIIYELHIRDFVDDDYIITVLDKLDYLETLGVNAIELMPINEFEGNDSWGYNPSFYFATDKAYGTKNSYKKFIDECHKRGIAVIIDMVLNHSFGQSPFVQMYFDENAGEWGQPTANNPWYNQTSPNSAYYWGYDFNHESQYTKDLVDRVNRYWLEEYKVDGFRFDFTKGFTNTVGDGWAYDASRISILKRMADEIWNVNPNAYVILEHFTANNEEKELAEYRSNEGLGMLIWGNINYHYNEASMGWLTNSDFSGVSYKQRGWSVPHLVGYMESHDEERLMFKNLEYGNSSNPEHDVKDIEIALERQKLVGAFFFTIPGPKMIWQFGELGYDYSINHCPDGSTSGGCRTSRKPVRWDYFDSLNRRSLYNYWGELIALRKAYPTFNTDNFSVSLSGAGKKIILLHDDMNVVIVGNFDVTEKNLSFSFPNTGQWYEYYSQTENQFDAVTQTFTMQPGEFRMYTTQYINRDDYILNASTNQLLSANTSFQLFPNPATSTLNLKYYSVNNQPISISLIDLSGRHIANIYNGNLQKGDNIIEWNRPQHIKPGVYIVIAKGARISSAQKLILQ